MQDRGLAMKFDCSNARKIAFVISLFISITAVGQQSAPLPRITQRIDNTKLTTLRGNVHPLARTEFDRGRAPDSMLARRMLLLLARSDEQEKALHQFLDDQQTAGSPNYHKWLTPEEFGQQFGPSNLDVQTVTTWLLNSGFHVDNIAASGGVIEFSGTAGQLRQVFRTELHKYAVGAEMHWANAGDPQIPEALAPVVKGFVSLNDFPRKPMSHSYGQFRRDPQTGQVIPLYTLPTTNGNYYALGPGDIQVIYNSKPLIQAGNDGTGQTIAVVGETNINLQDITDFRNMFGLSNTPNNHTTVLLNGPDPGIVSDEFEALLDVEWAGASAPGANIVLVASQGTETTYGVDLSALYIVDNNLAPVMTESYGNCEFYLGNAGNQFFHNLWEQAAAQGITVVVSAGDNGSAGCDNQNTATTASHGLAVSGMASTPFNVAAGGTDFNDSGTQATYFSSTNDPTTLTSAKSYVPEMTWNESCAGGKSPTLSSCTTSTNLQLWSGSGGPSNCSSQSAGGACLAGTAKPSWQTGTGVPADGVRDIPDVSFFSAIGSSGSNSFYVVCKSDEFPGSPSCQPNYGYYFLGAGGTSAASPIFAGAIALANQKTGSRLGNVNYLLYSIAANSGASCTTASTSTSCVYRDVTVGGISVPCAGGSPNCSATTTGTKGVLVDSSNKLAYMSGTGYDRATGLGSVNITNLVNAIVTAKSGYTSTTTSLTLNGGTTPVTAAHGASVAVAVSVTPTASTGDVSLIGNNKGIDGKTLTSGAANWSTTLLPGGNYTVTAHYAGDGTRASSDSSGISVSITPENSKTFAELVTFDLTSNQASYTSTTTSYGAPYVLRMDVADSAATISSTQGVTSKCSNGTASCPTGTVTLTANGSALDAGNYPLNGLGYTEDLHIQLVPGTYNIVATYPGDSSYNGSSGTMTIAVAKASTTAEAGTWQSAPYEYGSWTPLTADTTTSSNGVAPTGVMTLYDGGTQIDPNFTYQGSNADNTGPAAYHARGYYPFGGLGTHNLTAQYLGDSNYAASAVSAPFAINITQATTTIYNYDAVPRTTIPTIPTTLSVFIDTNSLLALPTGTVTFYDNGTAISGTVVYGGHPGTLTGVRAQLTASLSYPVTTLGAHVITATYSGDTYYKSSTMPGLTVTVASKLPATETLWSDSSPALLNHSVNLYANVSAANFFPNTPTLTGTVTFSDNGTALPGNITYSNVGTGFTATLPYTFTSKGTHSITASYSGDTNYATAASTPLALNVVGPFSVSMGTPTATISTSGGTGSQIIYAYSNGPFNGSVTFTCASVPSTATCSVNPGSVNLTTNGSTSATVNYTIPALIGSLQPHSRPLFWKTAGGVVLGGCLFCFLPGFRRRNRVLIALMVIAFGLLTISCGGGGSSTPPPPPPPRTQTYVLTITGTGSDTSVSTTTLTITQQ
jgi:hypothetical protein